MQRISYGMIAGLAATIVLSALMLIKAGLGLLPGVDAIGLLAGIAARITGEAPSPVVGWVLHLLIGVVAWGALFATFEPPLPGQRYWLKGIYFGVIAWLLMMIIVMPMGGAGAFGLRIGIGAPIATLVLHVIYGAVLGGVYGPLAERLASGGGVTPAHERPGAP